MTGIGDRIRATRKALKKSQKEFAQTLGLSENFIWMIEKGDRVPSDRTIADICREFGVSRAWLVEGVGEMYEKRSLNETLLEMANALMKESDDAFKKRFVMALLQNPPEWWDATETFIKTLSDENENPRGN